MGKGSVPDPPDYTPIETGLSETATSDLESAKLYYDLGLKQLESQDLYAEKSADLGERYATMAEDQAAYGKAEYEDLKPYLQSYLNSQLDYDTAARDYLRTAEAEAEDQRTRAKDLYDRYASTYAPKEDQYAEEAFAYGSKARQDEAAAAARGDVATSYGAVKDEAVRALQSYGVDPSQGAFGRTQAYDISKAAAAAAAGTYARKEQEAAGKTYEEKAIAIGQLLPEQSESQSKLATTSSESGLKGSQIGGKALEEGSSLLTSGTTAMGSPTTYASYSNPYTTLSGAYGSSASNIFSDSTTSAGNAATAYSYGTKALDSSYSGQLESYKAKSAASPIGAIGTLVGAGLGTYKLFGSDARIKRDVAPYTRGLDAVRELDPVTFVYNGEFGYEDDGHTHVGLIAQQVEPVMPEMVGKLGNVKALDYGVLIMALTNAVKELTDRIEQLEGK